VREFTIRPYLPEDASAVAGLLARHGWEERYIRGQLDALGRIERSEYGGSYVAVVDRHAAGFVSIEVHRWNRLAQIQGLAVDHARLRGGIGSALVREAERIARMERTRGIYVDTPVTNSAARAFYSANGYIEDYVMTRYYADDLDGITMVKFFTETNQASR
jgi:ribosomal protein S18 acetylase RimI-like enzyme